MNPFKIIKSNFIEKNICQHEIELLLSDFKALNNQNRLPPVYKDISYWVNKDFYLLKDFVDTIKKTPSNREHKKNNKVNFVHSDEDTLIIFPKTFESIIKYSKNTKWCISEKYNGERLRLLKDNKSLFIIISKQFGYKYALVIRNDNTASYILYDEKDKVITLSSLEKNETKRLYLEKNINIIKKYHKDNNHHVLQNNLLMLKNCKEELKERNFINLLHQNNNEEYFFNVFLPILNEFGACLFLIYKGEIFPEKDYDIIKKYSFIDANNYLNKIDKYTKTSKEILIKNTQMLYKYFLSCYKTQNRLPLIKESDYGYVSDSELSTEESNYGYVFDYELSLKLFSEDAFSAYSYAKDILGKRFIEGENSIKKDPFISLRYALDVIEGRFLEGEESISKVPELSFHYVINIIKDRWIPFEKTIFKENLFKVKYYYFLLNTKKYSIEDLPPIDYKTISSPVDAYRINCYILKERNAELEKIIIKSPRACFHYAESFLKKEFPEGEKTISQSIEYSYRYAIFLNKRFLKGEPVIKKSSFFSYLYALNVIKGRFFEAEDIILENHEDGENYVKNILKKRNVHFEYSFSQEIYLEEINLQNNMLKLEEYSILHPMVNYHRKS